MKSMIFAAGLGTRLKPLTDTLPKALVPVGGKPLIEHVLRKLMAADVDGAVVNVHHFADKVEEWLDSQDWICPVQVSDERERLLETGGAVLHARPYLENCGQFLIYNVDILSDVDLKWFASQVRPGALATLLVSNRPSSRCLLFDPETMSLKGWMNNVTGEVRSPYPVDKEKWSAKGRVTLSFEENETSLKSFKGILDGKFILFEYNSKKKEFTLDLKKEKVQKGAYLLRLIATDRCGNEAIYESEIKY